MRKKIMFFLILCGLAVAAMPAGYANQISYERGERRDPLRPLIGPGGALMKRARTSDLNIEGIIYDPAGGSLVIINGEVYKPGDPVQDANLIHIYKDRIVLVQEDEEKVLWLREEIPEEGVLKYGK